MRGRLSDPYDMYRDRDLSYQLMMNKKSNYGRIFMTDIPTKVELMRYRYKGFTKVEKVNDEVAMVIKDSGFLFIKGRFAKLEDNKEYLIRDIIENRKEVI